MFGYSKSPHVRSVTVSPHTGLFIRTISKEIFTCLRKSLKQHHLPQKGLTFPFFRLISFILSAVFFTSVFHSGIYAETLTSPAFEIDMGTINITGGSKSSSTYRLTDTVGQTFQGQFDSTGYVLKAGFQYIHTLTPFTFTISNLDLDFGSLVPGTPSLLTNILTVTTGAAYGYTVKTLEDHPLRQVTAGVATIPDTSCDVASPCTQTDATPWTTNTSYGFGYNVQGTDAVADFVNNTYFRPFPIQNVDDPATLMSRSSVATNSASTVTYKINISGSQAAGLYQNNIQYLAIPSF